MIIYIFAPKEGKEKRIAQSYAGAKLYGDQYISFKTLKEQERVRKNDLQKSTDKLFVFIGHADKSSYGSLDKGDLQYSPTEFVSQILKWLPDNTEKIVILGCELGLVREGKCQALEIAELLAKNRSSHASLANLTNITSYLLSANRFSSSDPLEGMIITLHPNATMSIFAWGHEAELKLVQLRCEKYLLLTKERSIQSEIDDLSSDKVKLRSVNDLNGLKTFCNTRQAHVATQLSILKETNSSREGYNKLISDLQYQCRSNLYQFFKFEHEMESKNLLTADDYCLLRFKCLRAFQSCEQLINLQNLYVRNGRDQTREFQVYDELQAKAKQYQEKYDPSDVSDDGNDKASQEVEVFEKEGSDYENFKLKMLLMVEPDLNARRVSLEKESAAYKSLLDRIDKASPQELPSLVSELQQMDQQKLESLTKDRNLFSARLAAWETDYDKIALDPKHKIEGPITINDLLVRPECNLLSTFSPQVNQSTANIFARLSKPPEAVPSLTPSQVPLLPPSPLSTQLPVTEVARAYRVVDGRLIPIALTGVSLPDAPGRPVTSKDPTPVVPPLTPPAAKPPATPSDNTPPTSTSSSTSAYRK